MTPLSPDTCRSLWLALNGDEPEIAMFLGECLVHSVEALVEIEQDESIDPLDLFVLRAFEFAQPADAQHVDEVLHLGRQVTRQLLNSLVVSGFATESSGGFCLTEAGRRSLETGRRSNCVQRRKLFHFLNPNFSYIDVRDRKGTQLRDVAPSKVPEPWEFDLNILRDAIERPADWKGKHGFPLDVVEVVTNTSPRAEGQAATLAPAVGTRDNANLPEAQRLVADKAQTIACALVINGIDGDTLHAYPVSPRFNLVASNEPVFSIAGTSDIREAFPALTLVPTEELAYETWLELARHYRLAEPEQARVEYGGDTLTVSIPSEFVIAWSALVVPALKDGLYWYIPHGEFLRLCPVATAGADSAAAGRLNTMKTILDLEQQIGRSEVFSSAAALRMWLNMAEADTSPTLRELSEIAFQIRRYRLAYRIAELEDITDAEV